MSDATQASMLRIAFLLLLVPIQVRAERSTARDVNPHRRSLHPRTVSKALARQRVGLGLPLVQLRPAAGYQIRDAAHAWGTALAVTRLKESLTAYRSRFPGARPVLIHDLSREGGGRLLPHHSHRRGRDVDVEVIRTAKGAVDVERTWFLVHALVRTGDVQYVFINRRVVRPLYRHAKDRISSTELAETFQWPRRGRSPGIVRQEPGHLRHFHVRFHRRVEQPMAASVAAGWRPSTKLGPLCLVSLEPL